MTLLGALFCALTLSACDTKSDGPQGDTPPDTPDDPPTVTYTVTFDANGGTFPKSDVDLGDDVTIDDGTVVSSDGTKLTMTVESAAMFTEPLKFPERSGTYAFVGWAKDKEGEELWDFEKDVLSSDLTLYAAWAVSFDFKLSDDGTYYAVRGIGGLSGDVEVPDTHNRKPVKEILPNAFLNSRTLTGIIIPDSVTTIGEAAFKNAINLESVTIGEGVTVLPASVFGDSDRLAVLGLPRSLEKIDYSAFGTDGTRSILEVRYAGTVDEWCAIDMDCSTDTKANPLSNGKATLYIGGEPATSVTINAEKINQYAFYRCKTLKSVTIGENVKEIGAEAFISNEIATLNFEDGALKTIGQNAFAYSSKLKTLTLPGSLTAVGYRAFRECTELTDLDVGGTKVIGDEAFDGSYNLANINLRSAEYLGEAAFGGNTVLNEEGALASVTIPSTVYYIGRSCFYEQPKLSSVTFAGGSNWFVKTVENNKEKEYNFTASDLSTPAVAATQIKKNGLWQRIYGTPSYSQNSDGTYSVDSVSGSGKGIIIIPETYNGKAVTGISKNAFNGCDGILGISIPASVTTIGENAFKPCTNLTSITVKGNSNCFGSANGFLFDKNRGTILWISPSTLASYSVTVPEGIKTIADGTFEADKALQTIELPSTLKTIGMNAFKDCANLTYLEIPNGVTTIGENAFSGCEKIVGIDIPSSVVSIGGSAFSGCTALKAEFIDIAPTNEHIAIENGVLYTKNGGIVWIAPEVLASGKVEIPNGVTVITGGAFTDCDTLNAVTIPDSVTSIGENAFKGCVDLASVTIPSSVETIGASAFAGCTNLAAVTIPNSVTVIEESAFKDCKSLAAVALPSGITEIANSTFGGCTSLASVTIPIGITTIGNSAFYGCSALSAVTIPENVTNIGKNAFSGCTALETVNYNAIECADITGEHGYLTSFFVKTVTTATIGDKVKVLPAYLFNACKNLTSIEIPDSVTTIGVGTFCACGLTSITIPDSVTTIGASAFESCKDLTSIVIPDSVTSIGSMAFYGCSALTEVSIGNGILRVGGGAFNECAALKFTEYESCKYLGNENNPHAVLIELVDDTSGTTLRPRYIHENTSVIAGGAFAGCKTINQVDIPDSVIAIGEAAFSGCSKLRNLDFGSGIRIIEKNAFYGISSSITEINLPVTVEEIGFNAFYGCYGVERLTTPAAFDTLDDMFGDSDGQRMENLTYVKITGTLPINDSAFDCYETITDIIIADGVPSIGKYAFRGCKGITRLDIPDSVTAIGSCAFDYCTNLTNLTIGNGITSIGMYAFSSCDKIAYTSYGNAKYLCNKAGEKTVLVKADGYGISSCTIADTTKVIAASALIDCYNITNITLPAGLKGIGENAFNGCSKLSRISIPSNVTFIGSGAFNNCTKLTSLSVPNGITNVNFIARSAIQSFIVPDSVKTIDDWSFNGCESLTTVTIPVSVTRIGVTDGGREAPFGDCTRLIKIKYEGTKEMWKKIKKSSNWDDNTGNYTVECADGSLTKAEARA